MTSKTILLLGLSLAIVLLFSSDAAARDLAETQKEQAAEVDEETNGVEEAKYPGGGYNGGYPGGGYNGGYNGGYPGGGYNGGRGGYNGGRGGYNGGRGGGYRRGYCRYGCCDRYNYGGRGCRICCRYAGETVDGQTQVQPQN